jgi:hypothetical protein
MLQRAKGKWRAWVAVAASYAFVLQLLLTGILATQMAVATAASADPFAICYGIPSADGEHNGAGGPAAHQTCYVCAVASTVPLSPAGAEPTVISFSSAVPFRPAAVPPALAGQDHSPRTSQGPPQVA